MMSRTPAEKLKVANACLDTAEESFNQATHLLEAVQNQQLASKAIISKIQLTFDHLHAQFAEIEKQLMALSFHQNDPRGR